MPAGHTLENLQTIPWAGLVEVRGVRKSKRVFTTRPDKTTTLPSDHGAQELRRARTVEALGL